MFSASPVLLKELKYGSTRGSWTVMKVVVARSVVWVLVDVTLIIDDVDTLA